MGMTTTRYERRSYYAEIQGPCGPFRLQPGTTFSEVGGDAFPPAASWIEPGDREAYGRDMAEIKEALAKMRKATIVDLLRGIGLNASTRETKRELSLRAYLREMERRWPIMVV